MSEKTDTTKKPSNILFEKVEDIIVRRCADAIKKLLDDPDTLTHNDIWILKNYYFEQEDE